MAAQVPKRKRKQSQKKIKKSTKQAEKDLVVLGIESTAHTFGVAVLRGREILSNEKDAYATKEGEGGMVPVKVAEHHVDVFDAVFKQAIENAKIRPKDIDIIAFSNSPGLGHTLRIGAAFARSLALRLSKPLVPVNHCIAHLEIGRLLTGAKDPVLLYASGANTQVIAYEAGRYRVFGETLDIGVGNFLDSFGRELGLGFPAGPQIEKLALKGKEKYDKSGNEGRKGGGFIRLPYSVKGMDVAFGGMLTNLKQRIKTRGAAGSTTGEALGRSQDEELCFSVQETVFAMLVEVTERALAHTGKTEVVLGGGVACNKRLQEMCRVMCEERGAKSYCPENQYLVDNAAMIAWTGFLQYASEKKNYPPGNLTFSSINPYERTDEVTIKYR